MQSQQKTARKGFPLSFKQILAIVVVLIVAYLVYGWLFPNVITITNTRSLTLSTNQTQFIMIGNSSTSALKLLNATPDSASFYITHVPVLYGPVVSFSLGILSSLNVSTDGSKVADMSIRLITSSSGSATVEITPLPATLGVKPSPSVLLLNPESILGTGGGSTTVQTTTVSGTTVASTLTTTVAQNTTQSLFQQALALMNKTGPGIIMREYNTLYQKDTGCIPNVYNGTYITYYSTAPPAPVDFYNVSHETPTSVTVSESALSAKNNVLITYSIISPSSDTTGPAIVAVVNTSSASFLRSVNYTGVYLGFNYSILNSSYSFQSRILNNCGAYISPP